MAVRMSAPRTNQSRWTARPAAEATPEGRAAALIRQLPPPIMLSEAQLTCVRRRVAHELSIRAAQPRRVVPYVAPYAWVAAMVVVVVVVLVGGWLRWSRRPTLTEWTVPAGSEQRLVDNGQRQIALVGPAAAAVDARHQRPVLLRSGRVAVHAGAAPVVVDAPGARVTVRAGAIAEVIVLSSHVSVAAFSGTASVHWLELGRFDEVAPNTSVNAGGATPLSPERAREIMRAVGTSPSAVTAPAATAPAATAPPAAKVPPAATTPPAAKVAVRQQLVPKRAAERSRTLAIATPRRAPAKSGHGGATQPLAAPVNSPLPPEPALGEPPTPIPPPQAPAVAPQPPAAPARAAPAAGLPAPGLKGEAKLLAIAVAQLRRGHDPESALATLDRYRAQFERGVLEPEATLIRVDALMALGKRELALGVLDRLSLDERPRGQELQALRGELRAESARCGEAIHDFTVALAAARGSAEERALYGRATCRGRIGDAEGARADLETYLRRFPHGKFADSIRRQLDR